MRYFDYNATAPMPRDVSDAWLRAYEVSWMNPSSPYLQAASVRVRLEAARDRLSSILGCDSGEVVFNSGATEGNNAILAFLGETCPQGKRVLASVMEHPSVIEPVRRFVQDRVEWLEVGRDGLVNLAMLQERLKSGDIHAVIMMAANNETGILAPWSEVRDLCRAEGVFYHCDAVQWMGKLPAEGLGGCSFVTGCAHKFGGPKGCGFIKVPGGVGPISLMAGGFQEKGHRPGTENYPSIEGMLSALESCVTGDPSSRDAFEAIVQEKVPGTVVVGSESPRLWNTSMLILPEFSNTRWVNCLSSMDFLVSTGSACATAKEGSSHVLAAMSFSPEEASRAVRASGGWSTSRQDWLNLADAIVEVYVKLTADKGSVNGGGQVIEP